MIVIEDLFRGELVRLTFEDPEKVLDARLRWSQDTEYWHLQASDMARPFSRRQIKDWMEKESGESGATSFIFMIQTLAGGRDIGDIELDGIDWANGDGWLGIGIGERDYWGKGYGTDAMRVVLRYAFNELNLHRLTLNVFADNPRAIRSYEKCGFVYEGRVRKFLLRAGQEIDLVHMGLLKEEWQRLQAGHTAGNRTSTLPERKLEAK